PASWQNTGRARIDSTVQKIGEYYYRFTKNEAGDAADGLERGKDVFLERSTVLTAPTSASDWDADPETTWQLVDTAMTTPVTGHAGGGPQILASTRTTRTTPRTATATCSWSTTTPPAGTAPSSPPGTRSPRAGRIIASTSRTGGNRAPTDSPRALVTARS